MDEPLIDLNAPLDLSELPSLMRRHPASQVEFSRANNHGILVGMGFGVLISIAFLCIALISDADKDFLNGPFAFIACTIITAGAFVGAYTVKGWLELECRDGFLQVDQDKFEYWTRKGSVAIPLDKLFGARVETTGSKEYLKLCYLADTSRGYISFTRDFKRYKPVSGPANDIESFSGNGNFLAREVVRHYIRKRKEMTWLVASVPPYAFKSVGSHLEHFFFGEKIIDVSFECDGKTIMCIAGASPYNVPVKCLKDIVVSKVHSKHGYSKFLLTLVLDPSSGYKEIILNLVNIYNADEVERYCRCLTTVLPEITP